MLLRRLTFFGGKGGVGKTTMASAFALAGGAAGERTLLVSTDPAHSTSDLLGVELGDAPSPVAEQVDAVEIDEVATAAAYVERVREDAHRSLPRDVHATVDRHLDLAGRAPGTLEAAAFDRLLDLFDLCPDRYDRVVVDTAPTGHTLRMLQLPDLLTAWAEGLAAQRGRSARVERWARGLDGDDGPVEDPVLRRLRARRDRLRSARDRLLDDAVFRLVLTPERLPVAETARALTTLGAAGLTVGAVVVNRVLPAEADGEYVVARRTQQRVHVEDARGRFGAHGLVLVEQTPRDLTDRSALIEVGCRLRRSGREQGASAGGSSR